MKRKHFISSIAGLSVASWAKASHLITSEPAPKQGLKQPQFLQPGDTIGITCPAGYLMLDETQSAIKKLEEWGFAVKLGSTIGLKYGSLAGTDAQRLTDMQAMLDDPNIKAIMCGRGGYGCNRIIDSLDFTTFNKRPKWLIGFSDITLLHTHIQSALGLASIHSKMCNSFLTDWSKVEPLQMDSINSIKDALTGKKMSYQAAANDNNKLGSATGTLVGGNLSIIYSAMGTKSQLNTKSCILFLEEVSERLYSIDRMLWNLKRSGSLAKLKGLIIGGFNVKPADKPEDEFAETVKDIVLNLTKEYKYPVCFDFPVGHQKVNYALKCGVKHHFKVSPDEVTLTEI